jgi:hypothetical protein
MDDDFLEEKGSEGPKEEEWPNHNAKKEIFFKDVIEVGLQKVSMLKPINNRLCKKDDNRENNNKIEESFKC